MAYYIAVYDWSLYTIPGSIPMSDIEGDTHSNDPSSPDYSSSAPTWIGETFTFNGGSSTQIAISDDDGHFEDEYVETGGAQTITQDVTINGTTYPADSVIEYEFSMLDAAGNEVFVVRIGGVNVGFGYPTGQEPTNGMTFTGTIGRDGEPLDSGDGVSFNSEAYSNMVCFAEGTLILTPEGERPVESLQPGDQVMTLDRGVQAIRRTSRNTCSPKEVSKEDKPVLIKAGALGRNLPVQDLIVSPQHRILVGGAEQVQKAFASPAFAPAKSLTQLSGIRQLNGKQEVTWVHFALDRHEVVTANGCLSESLLLGPIVFNGMPASERRSVVEIFGPPHTSFAELNGPPTGECLSVGAVRRHVAKCSVERELLMVKEIRKWDVDLAMEQYESKLLREAKPLGSNRKNSVLVE